jgi:hypothetical protein
MQPADGITVRQKSRAFFQRYRPISDIPNRRFATINWRIAKVILA